MSLGFLSRTSLTHCYGSWVGYGVCRQFFCIASHIFNQLTTSNRAAHPTNMCTSSLQFIYIGRGFFNTEHQQNQPTCRLLSNDFSLVHQSLMQDEDSMVRASTLFIPLTAVEPQQTSCTKNEKPAPNLLESASSIHPMYIVKRYTCLVAAFNNLVSLKILQLVAWNSRSGWDRQNFGGGPST